MTDPLVVAICLTRDRPAMTRRAVESFRRQTYANKRLLIWNTGKGYVEDGEPEGDGWEVMQVASASRPQATIGELRNDACRGAIKRCRNEVDIFAHWDDDDLSHPNRIAEQVALLTASAAECVGYNECVFWDTRIVSSFGDGCTLKPRPINCAYIYRNYSPEYCIGSSMMYLASAWQRVKFDHINSGEDGRFLQRVRSVGVSSLLCQCGHSREFHVGDGYETWCGECMNARDCRHCSEYSPVPRMVCSIHGGNTSHYNPEGERNSYTRAPEFDAHCERIMKL